MTVNFYELNTLVRFSVTFTNTASGLVVDPGAVTLWMQDPNLVQTSYTLAAGQVVRDGTGQYHFDFAPDVIGRWTYKWQGTAPAQVTSIDSYFIVDHSAFAI